MKAQKGDTVSVHYLGRYPGGKVFDTSMEKEAKSAGLYNPARDYKPPAGNPRSRKGDSGVRRSTDRNEDQRREGSCDTSGEGLRKNGGSSYGGQDSAVQTKSDQHQTPITVTCWNSSHRLQRDPFTITHVQCWTWHIEEEGC